MKKTFLILLLGIAAQSLFAQQIRKPDGGFISTQFIDQTAKKLMDTAGVTGLCIGVINDNRPAYVQAYGYKNKAKNELNDTP